MIEHVPYDLRPLLSILVIGGILAALPAWWLLRRGSHRSPEARWHALAVFTLFLTFDLVLFGAFTRLTDSGLGCPDWPGCYGHTSPLGAHDPISQSQAAMPTGPVTHQKAWIEMIHRYMATAVGGLIVLLCMAAWRAVPSPGRRERRRWSVLALVWVCIQGAFGALTVTMKLQPAIVTLHLLGGLLLLCVLAVLTDASAPRKFARQGPSSHGLGPLRGLALTVLALSWCQVALGAWVSTNYAVLACADFPTCQGEWWPPMDFRQGFEWWRPLGQTASGQTLSLNALTAIHWTHRVAAVVLCAAILWLVYRLRHAGESGWKGWPGLLALLALQVGTGLSNVVLQWPLLAALLHTGGAAGLILFLTQLVRRARGAEQGARSGGPAHADGMEAAW